MTIVIDKDKALALLEQAVEQNGKHHAVEECKYTLDGKTGNCIVGVALENVGVDMSLFTVNPKDNTRRVDLLSLGEFDVSFDSRALSLFRTAQSYQDSGSNWGTALENAKLFVK